MTGPWEDYKTESGPWDDYAASSVAPGSIAKDPMNMTPQERKKWARERERFIGKEGTFGTQVRQNLFDPNQEYVTDAPVRVLAKSFTNTLGSIVSAPKDIYNKLQATFDPTSPDNLRGKDQALGQGLSTLGSAAVGAAQDLTAPIGGRGFEGMKESWGKAPVQSLLTVAPFAPKVAREVKAGVGSLAEIPGRAADFAATRLTDMTLKQGTTLKPAKRRANVEASLEGGYLPNRKGVDKLAGDISTAEQAIGDGIASGDAANVRGTLDRAIANVEALREQAMRSANPEKNLAMIDDEISRLRSNPMQEGVEPVPTFKDFSKGKMGDYMREEGSHGAAMQRLSSEYKAAKAKAGESAGSIPIGELQKMKVEQGRMVKYQEKSVQPPDPFQASIDKARIRGMKEELEAQLFDVFPELQSTNQKLGKLYGLQDVLERAANRIEQNQGIGIALPIKGGAGATIGGMLGGPGGAAIGGGIGTLIGIIEHPSVAPRLAQALYRARQRSKNPISMNQSRSIVADRIKAIGRKLTDPRISAVGMAGTADRTEQQ